MQNTFLQISLTSFRGAFKLEQKKNKTHTPLFSSFGLAFALFWTFLLSVSGFCRHLPQSATDHIPSHYLLDLGGAVVGTGQQCHQDLFFLLIFPAKVSFCSTPGQQFSACAVSLLPLLVASKPRSQHLQGPVSNGQLQKHCKPL